jgi:hypothetical protein
MFYDKKDKTELIEEFSDFFDQSDELDTVNEYLIFGPI